MTNNTNNTAATTTTTTTYECLPYCKDCLFECACGEPFRTAQAAKNCSKCLKYLMPGETRGAWNRITGEKVG